MTLRRLDLTPEIQERIARMHRAMALYPNADEGYGPIEVEQLALAESVLRAHAAQVRRLDRLPSKATSAKVASAADVTRRAVRRRA